MYKGTTSTERLFRGDVCRLGECPDFRVSISTSSEVNVEDDVINALKKLDTKCRSNLHRGDELTRSLQNVELPFGWKLQATTCRDEAVWMDPAEKVEVNVSKIFEVTGVSKPDELSGDDNFEIRFSSEQVSHSFRGRHDDAWKHMEELLSTVQMLHDALRSEMAC